MYAVLAEVSLIRHLFKHESMMDDKASPCLHAQWLPPCEHG